VEDAFASYAVAYLSSVNSSRGLSKDAALKNGADEESALPDDIRYAPDYFLDSFCLVSRCFHVLLNINSQDERINLSVVDFVSDRTRPSRLRFVDGNRNQQCQ
jgi:hypothetical protein